jgi:hypothetical protein
MIKNISWPPKTFYWSIKPKLVNQRNNRAKFTFLKNLENFFSVIHNFDQLLASFPSKCRFYGTLPSKYLEISPVIQWLLLIKTAKPVSLYF